MPTSDPHHRTRYPEPLTIGSRIAITAFSSGVTPTFEARLSLCISHLQQQGFEIVEGDMLRQPDEIYCQSAQLRANELMQFLLDDSIDAVMPPWGGELAMEVLPLLDFAQLAHAKPKWILGYSDVSTLTSCLTSKLLWASVHCANLMELTPFQDDDLSSSLFTHLQTPVGGHFCQLSSTAFQREGQSFAKDPTVKFNLTETTSWEPVNFDHHKTRFSGRLIGGCLDTLVHLFHSPWLDLAQFKQRHHNEGVILFLENVEFSPTALKRALLGLQFKGVFDHLNGLIMGRNYATVLYPDAYQAYDAYQSQRELLCEAIGDVPFPILMNADIGHQPPNLTLINGALAEVDYLNNQASLTQWLL